MTGSALSIDPGKACPLAKTELLPKIEMSRFRNAVFSDVRWILSAHVKNGVFCVAESLVFSFVLGS